MSNSSVSIFSIGSTGLIGSHFLNLALKSGVVKKFITLTRREPKLDPSITNKEALQTLVNKDTDSWPEIIKKDVNIDDHSTIFSSFGTTRKNAGSAQNFIKIDHDINVNAFKAAKETGKFDTAVLVSSGGANKDSYFLYMATKGKIEQDLKDLKFKRTIILRPGMLLGERDVPKGLINDTLVGLGHLIKGTFAQVLLAYPIEGEEVAKAVLYYVQQPIQKEGEVLSFSSKDMLNLIKEKKL
ncbi:DEKNAAC101469 [Brettanomyces naardenensis]|uniref:DEKNAAC101469 n=1 Tax=Brettanomyces naardenensis TaxID=13370 RepID=A0A448YI11_BRENA|nr:DEKNAAC101469 [Brettanomyces naardenensis]